jgi:predicted nucleotidyltransferase
VSGMHISEDVARAFALWAADHPTALDLWLFGSRARGDHRPDSDVDLALHLAGPRGDALALYIAKEPAWEAELAAIAGHPVDLELLGFSDELDGIVAREGVWLWARE